MAKEKTELVYRSQGPEEVKVTHRLPVGFQVPCFSNSAFPSLSAATKYTNSPKDNDRVS